MFAQARSEDERRRHLHREDHEDRMRERPSLLAVLGVVPLGGREKDIPLERSN